MVDEHTELREEEVECIFVLVHSAVAVFMSLGTIPTPLGSTVTAHQEVASAELIKRVRYPTQFLCELQLYK